MKLFIIRRCDVFMKFEVHDNGRKVKMTDSLGAYKYMRPEQAREAWKKLMSVGWKRDVSTETHMRALNAPCYCDVCQLVNKWSR